MKDRIKVLIADDHAIVRIGIGSLLAAAKEFKVVGQAEDGQAAVARTVETEPDVVIMDLMMPVKDGVEATAEIHARLPDVRIVLLTTFGTSDGIAHALESGAAGAVLKSCAESELIAAIHAVLAGERYVSPDIRRQLKSDPPVPKLTDRQRDILRMISVGRTNKDIATHFGIQVCSVNEQIENVIHKLGATNRTEAVAIALRKHLLKI